MENKISINHENGNDANRLLAAVPLKPRSGVWGDDDIYKAYKDLVKELGELIPEKETIGLHISGAAAKCRSKAKMIKAKATILEDMVKAVCAGR